MSNSFKIGPMQSCFRSYMKRCHLTHKFTTPRECPPGPLQRLLTQTRTNRNMAGTTLRSNRSYRNIKKRGFSISQTIVSKNKDMDNAKFDLVKIEPVVNTGNYCQVLVTLKRKEGEDGRDRWVRNIRRRGSRTVLSVANAVDGIGLGNFYKDPHAMHKMNRKDKSKVARYDNPTSQCLDLARAHELSKGEPSNSASCQQDLRKTIESITKLLHSATKKVMQQHDRKKAKSNKKDLAKIFEPAETLTADKMVSKLRNNDLKHSVCLDQKIEENNKDREDQIEREMSIKKVKGQIYHKSEQSAKFYRELLDSESTEAHEDYDEIVTSPAIARSPLDCTDIMAAPITTEANEDPAEVVTFPRPIDAHRDCAELEAAPRATEANEVTSSRPIEDTSLMAGAPGECAEMVPFPRTTKASKDYSEIVTSSRPTESHRDCAETSLTMAGAPGDCAKLEAAPKATETSEDYSKIVTTSRPTDSHRDCAETSLTISGAPGDCTEMEASPRSTKANQEIVMSPMRAETPGDCAEIVTSSEPTAASRDCTETVKRPSLPQIHINIRGSVTVKRNSLGKLVGTYRKKTSTRIIKNDGRTLDMSTI